MKNLSKKLPSTKKDVFNYLNTYLDSDLINWIKLLKLTSSKYTLPIFNTNNNKPSWSPRTLLNTTKYYVITAIVVQDNNIIPKYHPESMLAIIGNKGRIRGVANIIYIPNKKSYFYRLYIDGNDNEKFKFRLYNGDDDNIYNIDTEYTFTNIMTGTISEPFKIPYIIKENLAFNQPFQYILNQPKTFILLHKNIDETINDKLYDKSDTNIRTLANEIDDTLASAMNTPNPPYFETNEVANNGLIKAELITAYNTGRVFNINLKYYDDLENKPFGISRVIYAEIKTAYDFKILINIITNTVIDNYKEYTNIIMPFTTTTWEATNNVYNPEKYSGEFRVIFFTLDNIIHYDATIITDYTLATKYWFTSEAEEQNWLNTHFHT